MLLDILFVYCKLNSDVSYRQGMHELAAPVLWVVASDALDIKPEFGPPTSPYAEDDDDDDEVHEDVSLGETDSMIKDTLNASYIEHDAFALFKVIMASAKAWYELGNEKDSKTVGGLPVSSPIVQRSKHIHEDLLVKVDPELAKHLSELELLPQIFLMYVRYIQIRSHASLESPNDVHLL